MRNHPTVLCFKHQNNTTAPSHSLDLLAQVLKLPNEILSLYNPKDRFRAGVNLGVSLTELMQALMF